jgi:hypothetical protein
MQRLACHDLGTILFAACHSGYYGMRERAEMLQKRHTGEADSGELRVRAPEQARSGPARAGARRTRPCTCCRCR